MREVKSKQETWSQKCYPTLCYGAMPPPSWMFPLNYWQPFEMYILRRTGSVLPSVAVSFSELSTQRPDTWVIVILWGGKKCPLRYRKRNYWTTEYWRWRQNVQIINNQILRETAENEDLGKGRAFMLFLRRVKVVVCGWKSSSDSWIICRVDPTCLLVM